MELQHGTNAAGKMVPVPILWKFRCFPMGEIPKEAAWQVFSKKNAGLQQVT